MNFQINKTSIIQAIRWEKVFKWVKILKFLCWILLTIFVLWCLFGYFGLDKSFADLKSSAALLVVFLCLGIIFWEANLFFEKKVKNPSIKHTLKQALQNPVEFNFAAFLDFEAAKICKRAVVMAKRHSQAQLKDILLYCLAQAKPKEIIFAFQRAELDLRALRNFAEAEMTKVVKEEKDADFEKIIIEASNQAEQGRRARITAGDILSSFASLDPVLEKFLVENDFKREDVKNLVNWFYKIKQRQKQLSCW